MFQCRICKTHIDKTHVALKWHVEYSHSLHTCRNAHCVAAFKTESARNIHASVHIQKTRQCDHCSEQFNHHFALKHHMVVHEKHHEHKCTQCGRAYFRPQDLKEHMSTAHQSVTFPCQSCGYKGRSKRMLKQHELLHKEPSIVCEFCSAVF